MIQEQIIHPHQTKEEQILDQTLRPRQLREYIGQERVKKNLEIGIRAAQKRHEPLEHILLYGQPGLGKTTLAHIVANEMGVAIKATAGPALSRVGDIAALLTNLEEGAVLFIDEIHRLPPIVEEVLFSVMEDFVLDMVLGKGPGAQVVRLDVPRFTLIGATTRLSLLSAPLRDRFGLILRQEFYSDNELKIILLRSAQVLGVILTSASAEYIAQRARRTPRIANRLLKRVRDVAEIRNITPITPEVCQEALSLLHIDTLGLDEGDRAILSAIIHTFHGGPVGLQTIAAVVAEEQETVEEIYEPFLMQLGFLQRTPRGRIVTPEAYHHLGIPFPREG